MVIRLLTILTIWSVALCAAAPSTIPFLGVGYSAVVSKNIKGNVLSGVQVDYIIPESSAAASALKPGDIIFEYDLNQFTSTQNIAHDFKQYITTQKNIGSEISLRLVRENEFIYKHIDNQYIQVDYSQQDVLNAIKELPFDESLQFEIKKTISIEDVTIALQPKPFVSASTPNIDTFTSDTMDFINPFFETFFSTITEKYEFKQSMDRITSKHLENEWWDNSFKNSITQFLHINFHKLAAFNTIFRYHFKSKSPQDIYNNQLHYLDISVSTDTLISPPKSTSLSAHISFIKNVMSASKGYYEQAIQSLSAEELTQLNEITPRLFKGLNTQFTVTEFEELESEDLFDFINICKKIDQSSLALGHKVLMQLYDDHWLHSLEETLETLSSFSATLSKTKGPLLYEEIAEEGLIVIGGSEQNVYAQDVWISIDLGGDDIYRNNAGGNTVIQSTSLLIDFKGNDYYTSTTPFSQGSSFLGYALFNDRQGNDIYHAKSLSQGAAVIGHASFIDEVGDDYYQVHDFGQGMAFLGTAQLIDTKGSDHYEAALFSQGVGLPKGFGMLVDNVGNDRYKAGGTYPSSYGTRGIFKAASQGFGLGFRHVASGGIGALLDRRGHDHYDAGNFSLGTGYFHGLGIFMDTQGNDTYIGSRYTMGTSAHSAIGSFVDWKGHDIYEATYGSAIGIAWDHSHAYFLDYKGNDTYHASNGSFTMAQSAHHSAALFHDKSGKDTYHILPGRTKDNSKSTDTSNMSIFLDEGGDPDTYSHSFDNNDIIKVSDSFIFIDLIYDISDFNYHQDRY